MSQSPEGDNALAREVAELEMLAKTASSSALRRLREALSSESPVIRQVAATSLGRIGNPIAVPYLIIAIHDPTSEVRRSAVWALGQIGSPSALDALKQVTNDADNDVRRAAIWALGRGQNTDRVHEGSRGASSGSGHSGRRRKKRRRPSESLLLIAVGMAAMIITGGSVAIALLWSQPLGPGLVALEGQDVETPAAPISGAPPQCGGPPVMKIMVIGLDSEGYYAGFADAVRVVRVDFASPGIILLGIPRDLWVTIPGLEQAGINEDKLKMAYPYGNVDQIPGGGPSLLAQTLTFNLGLRVDRYAATDFNTFKTAIDQMGGIDILLPEDVGNDTTDPPFFPAGLTHMDGATALSYARVRPENSSDLGRMDRQNQVIAAIRARLTSSEFLPQVPGLIEQLRGSVATDLSPAEISSLLCIAQKLEPEQLSIVKIDKPLVLPVTDEFGHERLLPDQDAIRKLVRAFDAGDLATLRQITGH